ncbi:MAG TPA: LLM class F420-dependent oxidoreductase [Solirubrobacterales bacterium]
MRAVKLAIHYSNFILAGGPETILPTLRATAKAADEGGCSTFTVMDHWFQMEEVSAAEDPMLEGYSTLGYLAGQTEQISLALLVTGVTYRHPGLLAKIVSTVDVLSQGRAALGIGAAWYEREHLGLGVPFPPTSERFERLEEALQVCRQMWSDDEGPFEGRHFQLAETICSPPPVQSPAPPILIGGTGEKKTLRLVARYADATNMFTPQPAIAAHKFEVLKRHCEEVGRDYGEIEKTIILEMNPLADVDGFLVAMEEFAALGVEQVWVNPTGPDPAAWVTEVAERVRPRLEQVGPT